MSSSPEPPDLPWHAALAYAVTGCRLGDLGLQKRPDLTSLTAALHELVAAGQVPSPDATTYDVPPDLLSGLGSAQFVAALSGVRTGLGIDGLTRLPPLPSRPLTADDRRLLADVPPHHGR